MSCLDEIYSRTQECVKKMKVGRRTIVTGICLPLLLRVNLLLTTLFLRSKILVSNVQDFDRTGVCRQVDDTFAERFKDGLLFSPF